MKKILIIGIGAGDPEYLTIQAVHALNQVDVFFILDKGASKDKLVEFRRELCRRYIQGHDYRFVEASSPEWERSSDDYGSTIADLNRDKQTVFERLIGEGMKDGECGAFLVWGDPTLYDSTLRIVEAIAKSGTHSIDYEVIPGASKLPPWRWRRSTRRRSIGSANRSKSRPGAGSPRAFRATSTASSSCSMPRTVSGDSSTRTSTSSGAPISAPPMRS